jgi:hypothetical protein
MRAPALTRVAIPPTGAHRQAHGPATIAWEGIAILPSGVVIAGDELRQEPDVPDSDGAIFKFIPRRRSRAPDQSLHWNLSPLVAGSVYAMQVSCQPMSSNSGRVAKSATRLGSRDYRQCARRCGQCRRNGALPAGRPSPGLKYRNPDIPEAIRVC